MKGFWSSFLGCIVILVVAVIIVAVIAWSRVPDMLANTLSEKLKVPVQIKEMTFSLTEIGIDNIEIGNIPGGILHKAFSAKDILFKTPVNRYLEDKIVIEEIDVDDIYLGLEFDSAKGTDGNWTRIMKNIAPANEKQAKVENGKSVFIKTLILTNIKVDVVYRQEGGKVKRLPTIDKIVLTNISSENGLPMDQVMNSVLGQMLKSVFLKQNLQNMLEGILNQQGTPLDNFIRPFRGLFNSRVDSTETPTRAA